MNLHDRLKKFTHDGTEILIKGLEVEMLAVTLLTSPGLEAHSEHEEVHQDHTETSDHDDHEDHDHSHHLLAHSHHTSLEELERDGVYTHVDYHTPLT